MRDISDDAAIIADMALIVRARFIEAVDTEFHRPNGGMRRSSSWWPHYDLEFQEKAPEPYRPDAAAISRSEEVLADWLLGLVKDDGARRLMVAWSQCRAATQHFGPFDAWCKKKGLVRRTAYRRVNAAFMALARELRKSGKMLRLPDEGRVSQLKAFSDREMDMVAEVASAPSWMADDAKPTDDPENRDISWAIEQNERRRQRAMANDAEERLKRAG